MVNCINQKRRRTKSKSDTPIHFKNDCVVGIIDSDKAQLFGENIPQNEQEKL